MKIAFLLDKFPQNGGVEAVTILLVNRLVDHGFEVDIWAKMGDKNGILLSLSPKVKFMPIPAHNFCADFFAILIDTEKIDIIVNQGAYPSTNKILAKLYTRKYIPIVSVLHNEPTYLLKDALASSKEGGIRGQIKSLFPYAYKNYICRIIKKNFKRINSFSETIVLLSPRYMEEYYNSFPDTQWGKLQSIPNPIIFGPLDNVPKEKIVLYVGRLAERHKKLTRLFDIWAKVSPNNPEWKLYIVGDGKDGEYYKSYSEKENLKNVFFEGFQLNPVSYYKRASILVMTSEYEGFPLTMIEAMRYGCVPIVYNSFSASNDIIANTENGYLVTAFNEDNYIDSLEKIMHNSDLLESMSRNAYSSIQKYDIEIIIKKWIALFEDVQAQS